VINVLDPFDSKVLLFQNNMQAQIFKVIKPCICFLIAYDPHQAHNIFALMFYLHCKSLRILENYVGWGNVIHLVIKCDARKIFLLLMIIFYVLNPTIQAYVTRVDGSYVGIVVVKKENNNIFGVGVYIEEFSHALVVKELFLFKRLSVVLVTCVDSIPKCWLPYQTNPRNFGITD
jgi:hypothetical protein